MSDQQHAPQLPGGWLPPQAPGAPRDEAPAPPASPDPFGEQRRSRWKGIGGVLIALGAILVKFKGVLLLIPKLKLLTTSASMLVSIAAYSLIWGWKFAVGFVVLLLVHEMGHVIQLRREGIAASAPLFIPFLGALVWAKSLGDNAVAEARVGLAGPVLGSVGAAACVPLAELTGNDLFWALAFTGFFLNLFNLLPVVPLDGGRAMAAMAPWMWFVGLFGIVALAIAFPNPIILLIAVVGGFDVYHRWRALRRGDEEARRYYRVRPRERALVAAVYIGLIVALVIGMDATHLERELSDA